MLEALKFWKTPTTTPELPEYPADYYLLEQFQFQNIFVCDELMKGKKHNSFITDYSHDVHPVHPSVYTSQKYNFFFKDLGDDHSYPYLLPEDFKPDGWLRAEQAPARIKGELWSIRPKAFISLDIHKQVGVQFNRQRVRITYPTTPIAWSKGRPVPRFLPDIVKTIDAWMYIGIPEYWKDQIGGIFQNQMSLYEHHPKKIWIDQFYKNDL